MKKVSSQIREKIEDTDYTLDVIEGDELTGRNAFLVTADDKYELWTERDDYAGYVIVIDGVGYEFVRIINEVDDER